MKRNGSRVTLGNNGALRRAQEALTKDDIVEQTAKALSSSWKLSPDFGLASPDHVTGCPGSLAS